MKNPRISRRKEILKIRAEINEKEIKEKMIKVNKNKSWFFEKIKKINESLDRQTHEGKKIEESNPKNQEMKKERLQ